ncbi:MAG TPA: response regulator [Polaromonas sp.]|uniref:response regulator n=1 Tax=Polaromonas sp. TaxID=1869339 RepID=UPI002D324F2C|nr:response regulator [Polaromonas sp.]HYW55885.1 response regulator [Polaromonas sp.]
MILRAFLVEDQPDIRDTVIDAMENIAPLKFIGFADGETAARKWLKANQSEWQLAIVDLRLKEGTGFGVLKSCQARKPEQKVVVLTGHEQQQIAERCLELGADMVFNKSSELDRLVEYCKMHAEDLDAGTLSLH